MARPVAAFRQLAHDLYADESLVEGWRAGSVLEQLQQEQIVRIRIEAVSMDSTSIKVHPDGTGARKKSPQAIGKSRAGWNTKVHLVAADARTAIAFSLSPGQAHDAQAGRGLLRRIGPASRRISLLIDRAYEGNETWQLALELGFVPVVPPPRTRLDPWGYDREPYKRRNEIERLFRKLNGFRRIFYRFEKLDILFIGFTHFALIADALRMC